MSRSYWDTRRGKVHALLIENSAIGEWTSTMDLNSVEVGGSEGCKRARELRETRYGGHSILIRHIKGTAQYEYFLEDEATVIQPSLFEEDEDA